MGRFLTLLLLIVAAFSFSFASSKSSPSFTLPEIDDYVIAAGSSQTLSVFARQEEKITYSLPFQTRYEEDPEKEWGDIQVQQKGSAGVGQKVYQVSYWYNREMERLFVRDEILDKPQDELKVRGTKKTAKSGSLDRCGDITYTGKMHVWTTSYDKNCLGCLGVTYTGLPAGYGVVAVDPKIIPLYSRLCIPGYGLAVAGDIGGAIKGQKVDLGFDDVHQGWWSARWTDIYLLQ